jgi:hypothetical protein
MRAAVRAVLHEIGQDEPEVLDDVEAVGFGPGRVRIRHPRLPAPGGDVLGFAGTGTGTGTGTFAEEVAARTGRWGRPSRRRRCSGSGGAGEAVARGRGTGTAPPAVRREGPFAVW